MHEVLVNIAKKNAFNEDLVRKLNYSAEASLDERLGSSIRYGYLFSRKADWKIPDFVQLYLDYLALKEKVYTDKKLKTELEVIV